MILQIIKKKIRQLTSVLGEVLPLCFSFPVTQNTLLLTLLSPNVWGFSPNLAVLHDTGWWVCNSILTLTCLEKASIPQVKGSVPLNCPPLQMPVSSSRTPGYPWFLSDLATNQRFPQYPPWVWFATVAHRTQSNTFMYQFIKGYDLESTSEQPDKKKHKVRSESIQGMGELLSLWSWGASPSWYVDVFGHLEDLQTLYYWDFMEASSHRDK